VAYVVKKEGKTGPRYYVVYRIGGRKRWRYAGVRRKDADRLKLEIERSIAMGTYAEPRDIAFSALAGEWLRIKEAEVRPSTFAAYKAAVDRAISFFGKETLVRSITSQDVDRYAHHLAGLHLSGATRHRSLTVLKAIFRKAVSWGYLHRNPAETVAMPKVTKPEIDYLEPDEIKRLIEATEERHRPLIMFACLTGARQSEILGLSWDDLDLEGGKAYIRRVLSGGKFYPPKTEASRRVIDLPPILVEELKIHRLRQAVELEGNPHNLVFTTTTGTPMDKRNVTQRILEPALRRAGLRKVGFHSLRHSYVSMLIHQGENIKTIQSLVGHSSAKVTWDIYSHVFEGAGREAARRLEESLFGREGEGLSKISSTYCLPHEDERVKNGEKEEENES